MGFSAQKILKDLSSAKKITDRQVMAFRMECRAFLQCIVKQLLLKSPLNYALVKNVTVLDPRRMSDVESVASNRSHFRSIVQNLVEVGWFREEHGDEALWQYSHFIQNVAMRHSGEFGAFNPSS